MENPNDDLTQNQPAPEQPENLQPEDLAAIFPPLPAYLRTTETVSASLLKMGFWSSIMAASSVGATLLQLFQAWKFESESRDLLVLDLLRADPFSAIGLLGAGMSLLAQWFNFQFSQKVKIALAESDSVRLTEAFRAQRDAFLWTVIGIFFSMAVVVFQIFKY